MSSVLRKQRIKILHQMDLKTDEDSEIQFEQEKRLIDTKLKKQIFQQKNDNN